MATALEGIRMIEVSSFHNGTAGGYMLSDLGAEVVKVEPPNGGDPYRAGESAVGLAGGGFSSFFEVSNRGKQSLALDLSKDEGRAILYRLVDVSDVFLTNYSDRVLDNLGIDWETLRARNPRLIYLRATGFGSRGPARKARDFDPTAQARSGLMWVVGDRDHDEPWQLMGAIVDQLGATMAAYHIMAALLARDRHGIGQYVETSLLGSALHLQAINVNWALQHGRAISRHSRKRARNPLSNHYRCADDKWIMLSDPQPDRFWSQLCTLLGLGAVVANDPRFSTVAERRNNCLACNELLERAFLAKPRDEWLALFEEEGAGFAYAPIYDLEEAVNRPEARENGYVTEYDHPIAGRVRAIGFPGYLSATPAVVAGPAPELGQHTRQILRDWLGCGDEEIARLEAAGVCRGAPTPTAVG